MTIVLSLFLFLSPRASACRCDPGPLKAVMGNLLSAKTAVIGRVEKKGESQILRVERSWGKFGSVIPLGSSQSSCSLGLKAGGRYLLLSFQPIEQFQKVPANFCQAFAEEIATAGPKIETLGQKQSQSSEPNPSWSYCTADKDCLSVQAVCGGGPYAIHFRYEKAYSAWRTVTSPRINCASVLPPSPGIAICRENLCAIETIR